MTMIYDIFDMIISHSHLTLPSVFSFSTILTFRDHWLNFLSWALMSILYLLQFSSQQLENLPLRNRQSHYPKLKPFVCMTTVDCIITITLLLLCMARLCNYMLQQLQTFWKYCLFKWELHELVQNVEFLIQLWNMHFHGVGARDRLESKRAKIIRSDTKGLWKKLLSSKPDAKS